MAYQDDIGLVLEAIVALYVLYINITLDIIITRSSRGNLKGREYLFLTYNQGVCNPGHITTCKVWSKLVMTLCTSFVSCSSFNTAIVMLKKECLTIA